MERPETLWIGSSALNYDELVSTGAWIDTHMSTQVSAIRTMTGVDSTMSIMPCPAQFWV